MFIYLLAENGKELEFVPVQVPDQVQAGPQCDYISISRCNVSPNTYNNFPPEDYDQRECDAIHAYASARLTIALWEQAIDRKIIWPWVKELPAPLKIERYNELVDAAFYQRFRSIELGTTGPSLKFTCRSFDIVAHETTHAIIRAINPDIYDRATFETYACVEALCDISAFLTLASQPLILDLALHHTGGDLRVKNFLSEFGEGYSKEPSVGIRSALVVQTTPDDPCAMGSPLIKLVYDLLVQLVQNSQTSAQDSIAKMSKVLLGLAAESEDYRLNTFYKVLKESF